MYQMVIADFLNDNDKCKVLEFHLSFFLKVLQHELLQFRHFSCRYGGDRFQSRCGMFDSLLLSNL